MGRRELLAAAAGTMLGASGCRDATSPASVVRRPAGVPLSRFGPASTAEEVSAGVDLGGTSVLVTGATSGLGFETLRVLALRGAHVIATGRTLDRAAEACATVSGRTTPLALDLEDLDGVVAATKTLVDTGRPLDVLICNAGVMNPPTLRLVNGVEQQFAVNHLGHFVLCQHLLGPLRAARQGRVVVVSSWLYGMAPPSGIDFENLDGSRGYDPQRAYGQSKLANLLFAFELARRTRGTNLTANALHPGVANTNLDRANPAWRRLGARLMAWNRPFVKSVEAAAATQVYLATAPALATVTGHYFVDCNPVVPAGPHIHDAALAAALWVKSEELTRRYLP
jgi:NAD(P)-dependent dehydrogenase (short-subunit alcohol dehydrogenase family)